MSAASSSLSLPLPNSVSSDPLPEPDPASKGSVVAAIVVGFNTQLSHKTGHDLFANLPSSPVSLQNDFNDLQMVSSGAPLHVSMVVVVVVVTVVVVTVVDVAVVAVVDIHASHRTGQVSRVLCRSKSPSFVQYSFKPAQMLESGSPLQINVVVVVVVVTVVVVVPVVAVALVVEVVVVCVTVVEVVV
jgi:uncharacterized protein (DUF2062 family)